MKLLVRMALKAWVVSDLFFYLFVFQIFNISFYSFVTILDHETSTYLIQKLQSLLIIVFGNTATLLMKHRALLTGLAGTELPAFWNVHLACFSTTIWKNVTGHNMFQTVKSIHCVKKTMVAMLHLAIVVRNIGCVFMDIHVSKAAQLVWLSIKKLLTVNMLPQFLDGKLFLKLFSNPSWT